MSAGHRRTWRPWAQVQGTAAGMVGREVAHTGDMDIVRLVVDGEADIVLRLGRHTIVADQRICQREQLPSVRRVGQRLRVADHRGVEDNFAGYAHLGAKRVTGPARSVVEDERGLPATERQHVALDAAVPPKLAQATNLLWRQ